MTFQNHNCCRLEFLNNIDVETNPNPWNAIKNPHLQHIEERKLKNYYKLEFLNNTDEETNPIHGMQTRTLIYDILKKESKKKTPSL